MNFKFDTEQSISVQLHNEAQCSDGRIRLIIGSSDDLIIIRK